MKNVSFQHKSFYLYTRMPYTSYYSYENSHSDFVHFYIAFSQKICEKMSTRVGKVSARTRAPSKGKFSGRFIHLLVDGRLSLGIVAGSGCFNATWRDVGETKSNSVLSASLSRPGRGAEFLFPQREAFINIWKGPLFHGYIMASWPSFLCVPTIWLLLLDKELAKFSFFLCNPILLTV